jgi:hypothetical protein
MTNAKLYDIYIEGQRELADAMAMFTPISEYATIFEADNPEVQQRVRENRDAVNKAQGGLAKIFNSIKRIISNVITAIRNFFDRARLSAEEKKAFDAFKAACAKDPSLKNKKITVRAWQEIEAKGAELRKQGEAILRNENAQPTECEQFIKNVENYISSTAGGVATTVTVDFLKKSMVRCPQVADMILSQMKSDNEWCDKIRNSMGEKSYGKFEKYTESMRNRSRVMMFMARLGKKRYENLHSAMESSIKGVADIAQGKITRDSVTMAAGALQNESLRKNVIDPAVHVGKAAGGSYVKQKLHDINNVTTASSRYARTVNKRDEMVKAGKKANETDAQFAARIAKQDKKAERLKGARKKELEKEAKKAKKGYSNLASFVLDH